MTSTTLKIAAPLGAVLGLGMAANGLFMLAQPQRWYASVPGVTATGAFNQHFVRDIGLAYLLIGAGFVAGALRPEQRLMLWLASSVWLAGHALFHLWEVAAGICGPDAIGRDFLGVTLPALLGLTLTVLAWRRA